MYVQVWDVYNQMHLLYHTRSTYALPPSAPGSHPMCVAMLPLWVRLFENANHERGPPFPRVPSLVPFGCRVAMGQGGVDVRAESRYRSCCSTRLSQGGCC